MVSTFCTPGDNVSTLQEQGNCMPVHSYSMITFDMKKKEKHRENSAQEIYPMGFAVLKVEICSNSSTCAENLMETLTAQRRSLNMQVGPPA